MLKQKFVFKVTMTSDPVPGSYHEIDDAQRRLQAMLSHAIGWYDPKVEIIAIKLVGK